MASIDAALAALQLQEVPNYTTTTKEYRVNRSTLSRRYRGIICSRAVTYENQSILTN